MQPKPLYAIAFAVLTVLSPSVLASDKIVIAHRGASGYLPEHTLEAYAVAHAMGADFIEPDVVMTQDGAFICLHDIHLEGTTNVEEMYPDKKRQDGRWYAADFTLKEIKGLRAHERLDGRFPKDKAAFEVPALAEMIELVQGLNQTRGRDVGIYPELKSPGWHTGQGLAMEEKFLQLLKAHGYEGKQARVFVQCFEAGSLKRMREELGSALPQILLIPEGKLGEAMLTPARLDEIKTFAEGIGPGKDLIKKIQMSCNGPTTGAC